MGKVEPDVVLAAIGINVMDGCVNRNGCVMPWMVRAIIGEHVSEKTVQRRMLTMYRAGKIIRLSERGGYLRPSDVRK